MTVRDAEVDRLCRRPDKCKETQVPSGAVICPRCRRNISPRIPLADSMAILEPCKIPQSLMQKILNLYAGEQIGKTDIYPDADDMCFIVYTFCMYHKKPSSTLPHILKCLTELVPTGGMALDNNSLPLVKKQALALLENMADVLDSRGADKKAWRVKRMALIVRQIGPALLTAKFPGGYKTNSAHIPAEYEIPDIQSTPPQVLLGLCTREDAPLFSPSKKRPRPEEFEDLLPPQPFMPDSVPATPASRPVLRPVVRPAHGDIQSVRRSGDGPDASTRMPSRVQAIAVAEVQSVRQHDDRLDFMAHAEEQLRAIPAVPAMAPRPRLTQAESQIRTTPALAPRPRLTQAESQIRTTPALAPRPIPICEYIRATADRQRAEREAASMGPPAESQQATVLFNVLLDEDDDFLTF